MLTERQFEVLQLMARDGLPTTDAIAASIGVAPVTVSKHLAAIRAALFANTNPQAVYHAFQLEIFIVETEWTTPEGSGEAEAY